jgi:ATP-binding cassette, subfamily G (WHITE), member 2, SNQ2
MASNVPLSEIREEGPAGTDIAVVPRSDDPSSSPRICPAPFRPRAARRESSASHVNVDFFDKEGVNELSRTLTRMSTHETLRVTEETPDSDAESEVTLSNLKDRDPNRPIDFEKGFRHYVKQYVVLSIPFRAVVSE